MATIKVIALINMKGGVGKTTLAVNIAGALAKFHGKKVLVIDNDPQFNATQSFVKTADYLSFVKKYENCTVLDVHRDRPTVAPSIVFGRQAVDTPKPSLSNAIIPARKYENGKVDLVPSTLELMELDSPQLGTEQRLSCFTDEIKGAYDFILIDCPPTMSLFTLSAYIASDAYLIPIKPDGLSAIGVSLLERAIVKYARIKKSESLPLGVIFTLVKKHRTTDEFMQSLRNSGRHCFETCLKQGINAAGAVSAMQLLFEYPRTKPEQGQQVKAITAELVTRIQQIEKKGANK